MIQQTQETSNKKYFLKYTLPILLGSISFIILLFGIIFADPMYFWSLLPLSICYIWYLLVNKTFFISQKFKSLSITLILCFTIFSFLNLFISLYWFFSLFIPICLLILLIISNKIRLKETSIETKTSNINKKITIITFIFLLIFCSFTIPSYVANNHKNPESSFCKSYSNLVINDDDLAIYGGANFNIEHVIAQSWYKTDYYFVNDPNNLLWCDSKVNNSRGNYVFGVIKDKTNATEVFNNNSELSGWINKTDKVFEPIDEYKGDIARVILYMYVTYKDDKLPLDKLDIKLMKQWAKLDKVSAIEKTRNDLIQDKYGFSNKFIRKPSLIKYISEW